MIKTGKKVFSLLSCVLMLVALLPRLAVAADAAVARGTCGKSVNWTLSNTGVLTISGTGPMEDYDGVIRPSPWDKSRSSINKVVISDGVTTIGDFAFSFSDNLTSVSIPESVSVIGAYAFEVCGNLVDVTIPGGVRIIGDHAFYYCNGLASVTICGNVDLIDEYAFYNCDRLRSVTFLGSAPMISDTGFGLVTATVCYPCHMKSWTDDVKRNCDETITWKPIHSFDGKGFCTDCGKGPELVIETTSSFSGWNGAAIEVFEEDIRLAIASFSAPTTARTTIPYDPGKTYTFRWFSGGRDNLCSFVISLNGEVLISGKGNECSNQQIFYTMEKTCTHQYGESVTVSPTCTLEGFTKATCMYCGYTNRTNTVPALGHSYVGSVCTVCQFNDILCTGNCGGNLRWQLTSNGVLTLSGIGDMEDYTTLDGGGEANTPWYRYRLRINHVVIQSGITSIGNCAFYECYNLMDITLPEGVTDIGEMAFAECTSLRRITIPDGVTAIDNNAFSFCKSLRSITLPDGISSIEMSAFSHCTGLVDVTIPASVTEVNRFAFSDCTSLSSITFLGSAPTFDRSSFVNVTASAYYPCNDATWSDEVKQNYAGSITWVGHVFSGFVPDQSATCTDNAMAMGTCLHCGAKENVQAPGTATGHRYDGEGVCVNCGKRLEIIINLTNRYDPFEGWSGAYLAVYDGDVCVVKGTVDEFMGSNSVTLPYSADKTYTFQWISGDDDGSCVIEICIDNNVLLYGSGRQYSDGEIIYTLNGICFHYYETVTVPPTCTEDGVTSHTCTGCGDRYSITTAATGHSYVNGVCAGCQKTELLSSGVCGSDLRWELGTSGVLTVSGTGPMADYTLPEEGSDPNTPWAQYRHLITKVVMEDGVTTVGEYAFHGCTNMTEVTIPGSVTAIGKLAFYNCNRLTEVAIPEGVSTIGSAAFRRCSGLTEVILPEGLSTIGKIAFFDCTGLTDVSIPETVTDIGEYAFGNCTGIAGIEFLGTAPSIAPAAFKNVSATACYLCSDETWNDETKQNYSGTLTWEETHSFGDDVITPGATCTEDATVTKCCLMCDYTETTILPGTATDHSYVDTDVPPTCTDLGFSLHKCQVCGYTFYDNVTPATGHSYENGTCTRCGDVEVTKLSGDITGDGKINIMDVVKLYAHVKGAGTLTDEAALQAADYTGDGKINIMDIAKLYAAVKG